MAKIKRQGTCPGTYPNANQLYKDMMLRPVLLMLLALLLAACGPQSDSSQALSVTLPPEDDERVLLATPDPTQPPPTFTPDLTPTDTPTVTPTPTPTPTPEPTAIPQQVDHYLLARPISSDGVDYLDRTYGYGDTQRDARPVHYGVDFFNPTGTPVLAAAAGTVIYAGDDLETLFGPQPDYYGNLIVIEHEFRSPENLPVFTLYGHLDRVLVGTGHVVEEGEQIGFVGGTGVAIGPHLHFEVRVGDPTDFGSTRNPDLWIKPYVGFGTLAARVVNSDGEFLPGEGLTIRSLADGTNRYAFTYASDAVNSSAGWGENVTMGDMPMGSYEVYISNAGRVWFRGQVEIQPNQTTWLEIVIDR